MSCKDCGSNSGGICLHKLKDGIETAREMFDLEDWAYKLVEATGNIAAEMAALNWPLMSEKQDHTLILTYLPSLMRKFLDQGDATYHSFGDHEWGHVVMNPHNPPMFATGLPQEETRVSHITYACWLLRESKPNWLELRHSADIDDIAEAAYCLCHLDENQWRRYMKYGPFSFEGERLPAMGISEYHEHVGPYQTVTGRAYTLCVDMGLIAKQYLEIKDVILRETWRVVLNPYDAPHRYLVTEHKLDSIIGAMKYLGW